MPLPPRLPRPRAPHRAAGFVRHEFYLLGALLLLVLAVALPRVAQGRWGAALAGAGGVLAVVLGGLALLLIIQWLRDAADRPDRDATSRLARGAGFLLRLGLFGLPGAALAAALAANHQLGARGENLASALGAAGTGLLGTLLHARLGPGRFWPAFGWFALALLGALLGGLLGLLTPEPWGVDAGVIGPILLFAAGVVWRARRPKPSSPPAEEP